VGEKELQNGELSVRNFFSGEQKSWKLEDFMAGLAEEITSKKIQKITK
jgi:threonyl-tRNA synthetase